MNTGEKNEKKLCISEDKLGFAEVASNSNITMAFYIKKKKFLSLSHYMAVVIAKASSLRAPTITAAKQVMAMSPLALIASVWK